MKKIYPFQKTVFRLGEMYYSLTKQKLGYYPVAVHESHKVSVGVPIFYSQLVKPARERVRLKNLLEDSVKKLYQDMESNFPGEKILTPRPG